MSDVDLNKEARRKTRKDVNSSCRLSKTYFSYSIVNIACIQVLSRNILAKSIEHKIEISTNDERHHSFRQNQFILYKENI